MNKSFIIAGPKGSGKTTLISGLLQGDKKSGAFKPFSNNQLYLNANELDSDGEVFCSLMAGEPSQSFVTPYVANEAYPMEMAFRRDGIRIDWAYLKERKNLLTQHYSPLFIEVPQGLSTPMSEDKSLIEWIKELDCKVFYCLSPLVEDFALQMAEISILMQNEIDFHLWINNTKPPKDGDYLFYLWEKSEKAAAKHLEGMLPFSKNLSEENLPELLAKHLPGLLKAIES